MSQPASPDGSRGVAASDLKLRIVSALVMVAVGLALTLAGGVWFRLLCAAAAAAILYEWVVMTSPAEARTHRALLALLFAVLIVLLVMGVPAMTLVYAVAASVALAVMHAIVDGRTVWPSAGLVYAGLAAIAVAGTRGGDAAGLAATLFLFAVVWATDIFAYFVGRRIGGPKLAPSISPGKTWSGALGGVAAGVACGLVVVAYAGAVHSVATMAGLALFLSVVAQAGDLFESSLKRRFSMKDSSHLIPGHGGVMDRLDGLVAAGIVFFAIGAALGSPDTPSAVFFGR